MIEIKNTPLYNEMRQNILGGKVTSIWEQNSTFMGANTFPIVKFKYFTANFSSFEKNFFKRGKKMIYHLSGYGTKYNEALASFIGESSERYTFAVSHRLIKDLVIKDNYINMVKKYGEYRVCSLDFINNYFKKEDTLNYVEDIDSINWVEMNSLIDIGEKVYIPLQFIAPNNELEFEDEKKFTLSTISTGTASHETFRKSIENSIIEYLQIDSFNLWWYGGVKGKEINLETEKLLIKYFNSSDDVRVFLENFYIKFTDISFDKDIDIIVCEIFGKNDLVPLYTIGVQGGIGFDRVLYRSLMECLAVLEYNINIPWIDNERYISINKQYDKIDNLDDNVILYSKFGKPDKAVHDYEFYDCVKLENHQKSYDVFESIKKFSRFAGFLNITLPEFEGLNLVVSRIYIPELLPICLPSYPPYYHERYKYIGGIKNNVPHPLA